ncbi:MAG: hypothetical protein J6R94_03170 [Agathobacter sp.]|nr:hypothetical protein [Agathobacter sp.]
MKFSFLKEKGSKYLIWILLGVMLLIVVLPSSGNKTQAVSKADSVTQGDMEESLKRVLMAMEGVGKVEVMITTLPGNQNFFGEEEETPLVCGVVVVAQGAGDALVESRILEAVKALFGIDSHKISIVKMA